MTERQSFVNPASNADRVELPDGEWVSLKRELCVADQKEVEHSALLPPVLLDGRVFIPRDMQRYELVRMKVYLLDWSLRDANKKTVPVSAEAIGALLPWRFQQINDVIHQRISEREAAEKNAQSQTVTSSSGTPTTTAALSPTTD